MLLTCRLTEQQRFCRSEEAELYRHGCLLLLQYYNIQGRKTKDPKIGNRIRVIVAQTVIVTRRRIRHESFLNDTVDRQEAGFNASVDCGAEPKK